MRLSESPPARSQKKISPPKNDLTDIFFLSSLHILLPSNIRLSLFSFHPIQLLSALLYITMAKPKVCLAYSGGLDTSKCAAMPMPTCCSRLTFILFSPQVSSSNGSLSKVTTSLLLWYVLTFLFALVFACVFRLANNRPGRCRTKRRLRRR